MKRLTLCLLVLLSLSARAEDWAVVVGVNDYRGGLPPLKYAAADATAIAAALPGRVYLLTSRSTDPALAPTSENVLRCLDEVAKQAKPGDSVVFFFAGHGVAIGGETCLLTSDSDHLSAGSLLASSLRGTALMGRLESCKASKILLLIDACRNDPTGKNVLTSQFSRNLVLSADYGSADKSAATFFSCSLGQRSYELEDRGHGLFTYYLLEGLRPAGKRVTLSSLVTFVRQEVKRQSGDEQAPMLRYEGPGPEEWTLVAGPTDPAQVRLALDQEKAQVAEDRKRLEAERASLETQLAALLKAEPGVQRPVAAGEDLRLKQAREQYAELLARQKTVEAEGSQLDWQSARVQARALQLESELARLDPKGAAEATASMQRAQTAMDILSRSEDERVTADSAARAAQARADALAAENAALLAARLKAEGEKAALEAEKARLLADNARLAAEQALAKAPKGGELDPAQKELVARAEQAEAAQAEAEARVKALEAEVARLEGERSRLEASIQRLEAETARVVAYRQSGDPAAAQAAEKAVQEAEARALAAEKARIEAEKRADEALARADELARKAGKPGTARPGDPRVTRRGRLTDIVDWSVPEATELPAK